MSKETLEAFERFKNDIKSGKRIHIWPKARNDAAMHFNLNNLNEITDFILNDGMENMIARPPASFNGNSSTSVYGIKFSSHLCEGFFAVIEGIKGWSIKSFHLDNERSKSFGGMIEKCLSKGGNSDE